MAFVRKDGNHKPRKGESHDWNSELLEPVVKDLDKSWVSFVRRMKTCKDDCFAGLEKLLDRIRQDLCGEKRPWLLIHEIYRLT